MNYSIFVHFYTVNWNVQPDQHLHAMTLCIGMPNLINMLLSSFCFCAANWNVNYSTFVHFYTVNWNVQPDQHLYASTLHIGMWTTQCFWYFYAANWSVQLIKHFLSFLLIRALVCDGRDYGIDPTFWEMFTRCYYELTVSSFFWTWWSISYLNCCWLWFELATMDGDRAIRWRAACCLCDLTHFWILCLDSL